MFSKGKDQTATPEPSVPVRNDNNKRSVRAAPSIISADMTVKGTIEATGDIQIDGKVEGDVTTGSLTIGEKAVVNGEIAADEVIIRGHIIGSVRGRKIQLCSTSHVEGDVLHQALAVETGAFFEGNCRHSDDPLSDSHKQARLAAPKADDKAEVKAEASAPAKGDATGPNGATPPAGMAGGTIKPPLGSPGVSDKK